MSLNKVIILFIIIVVITTAVLYYGSRQQKVKECKEKCIYILYDGGYLGEEREKADYWRFGEYPNTRNFPTQEQCIDYCLSAK